MNWKKLIIAILIPQIAGGVGAVATTPKIRTWYAGLEKPFFSPPNWVFGPVWTLLFLLMGIALYLIWESGKKEKKEAMKIFGVQLGLNVLWSWIFFGGENPGLAVGEIVILWLAIRSTIKSFSKISKRAGQLLIPYLAWVSFAGVLNGAVWWLNR